jgi:hypothetical protein
MGSREQLTSPTPGYLLIGKSRFVFPFPLAVRAEKKIVFTVRPPVNVRIHGHLHGSLSPPFLEVRREK